MTREEAISTKPAPDDDHCCGCCVNVEYEDAYGFGWCEVQQSEVYCGEYCKEFKEK